MRSDEEVVIGGVGGPEDVAPCFTEAVYAYLQEVDDLRAVCRRHEGTAGVLEQEGILQLTRFFAPNSQITTYLESTLRQLPAWETDALWPDAERRACQSSTFSRHTIVWEGCPLVVKVFFPTAAPFLQVDLLVPPWDGDLPRLPLRTLADALRCHEFLVPQAIAEAVPPPTDRQTRFLGIREHLERATPLNFCAAKCI